MSALAERTPVQLPHTYTEEGEAGPIQEANLVQFRLLYGGEIKGSSKTDTRPEIKHAIRREFHPQLRRLWNTAPNLDLLVRHRYFGRWVEKYGEGVDLGNITDDDRRRYGIEFISENWARNGFKFIPLVTKEFALRCAVEIIFLRPEEPHHIMHAGDLDGRVKTIFDALRIPDNLAESAGMGPQEDETPFFCLLEDDKLISSLTVTTDQLLALPKERNVKSSDAFLVIQVKVEPVFRGTFDAYF
jgi:hypothetical protein